jgi:hypothetical protein
MLISSESKTHIFNSNMTIKSEEPIQKKELVNMLFGMRSSACATYNNKLKLARSLSSKP